MSDLTPAQKRRLAKIGAKFQGEMQKLSDKSGLTMSITFDGKTTEIARPKAKGEGGRER